MAPLAGATLSLLSFLLTEERQCRQPLNLPHPGSCPVQALPGSSRPRPSRAPSSGECRAHPSTEPLSGGPRALEVGGEQGRRSRQGAGGLLLVPGFTSLSCTGFLKYRCNLGLWLILFNFLLYCIIFSQAKPSTLLSPLQTWLAWHIHWVRQPNASPTAAPLWAPLPVHPTSNTQLPSAPPPTDTEPCCPLTCGPMYMLIPSTTIYCPLTLRQEVCTQFLVWKI